MQRTRTLQSIAGTGLVCAALSAAAAAQTAGILRLDPTFGSGGRAVINVMGKSDYSLGMSVQPNGNVLVGGISDVNGKRYSTLIRLESDGTLDKTFGENGVVAGEDYPQFHAFAVMPDGNIIAAGDFGDGFGVMRFSSAGAVDTSFGINGRTRIDLRVGSDIPKRVKVLPDGSIVIAGAAGSPNPVDPVNTSDFGVVRLLPSGRVDDGFGNEGIALTDFGWSAIHDVDFANAMAIQKDGKIVAGGFSSNLITNTTFRGMFALARYSADGTVDAGFGAAGKVTTLFPGVEGQSPTSTITDVLIQPDGKILAVGRAAYNELAMARYLEDGSLDRSFGDQGIVVAEHTAELGAGYKARLMEDGRILVAGAGKQLYAALFNADGHLIRSAQSALLADADHFVELGDLELGEDGKIAAAGRITPPIHPQPDTEAWWRANDVFVVRSEDLAVLIPEPSAGTLIVAAALLGLRRRGGSRGSVGARPC